MKHMSKLKDLLPGEEWRVYPKNEMYSVSNKGRVYSYHTRHPNRGGSVIGLLSQSSRYNLIKVIGDSRMYSYVSLADMIADTWLKNRKEEDIAVLKDPNLGYFLENIYFEKKNERDRRVNERIGIGMSGSKHPKVKGYYEIEGIRYESASQAAIALGIYSAQVIRRANNTNWPSWKYFPNEQPSMASVLLEEQTIKHVVQSSGREDFKEELKRIDRDMPRVVPEHLVKYPLTEEEELPLPAKDETTETGSAPEEVNIWDLI